MTTNDHNHPKSLASSQLSQCLYLPSHTHARANCEHPSKYKLKMDRDARSLQYHLQAQSPSQDSGRNTVIQVEKHEQLISSSASSHTNYSSSRMQKRVTGSPIRASVENPFHIHRTQFKVVPVITELRCSIRDSFFFLL